MQCEFLYQGTCDIASSLSGVTCATTPEACKVCTEAEQSQTENAVTYSLAYSTLHRKGLYDAKTHQHVYEGIKHFCTQKQVVPIDIQAPSSGVGNRLAVMFSFVKKDISTCGTCRFRVKLMNRWGPELCKEKVDIIMNWIKESAIRNRYPFVPEIVKPMIHTAIWLESKK
jgi:hypothetical protein